MVDECLVQFETDTDLKLRQRAQGHEDDECEQWQHRKEGGRCDHAAHDPVGACSL
jgi:hypothetical protein